MERDYITHEQIIATRISAEEQQCIISWERLSDTVEIFCSDNKTITRLKRLMQKDPISYRCWIVSKNKDNRPTEYGFELPSKKLISFRAARTVKTKRHLTQEQREANKQRLKAAAENRRKGN